MSLDQRIETEFLFQTSRSGGKGGQHVNKTESKVELKFHIASSQFLSEEQKTLMLQKLANKLDTEGFLHMNESGDRSQHANKETLVKKIFRLLENAIKKQKKRIPTKISKGAREKRLNEKKRRSEIKSYRGMKE